MDKEFVTSDFILAATLVAFNFSLRRLEGPVKVGYRDVYSFVFPKDDKISEIVEQFNSDQLSIEPKRLMLTYRNLKRRMFDFSDRKEG